MVLAPDQRERLRTIVAPVEARILSLIDARPKQPGMIPGKELTALYLARFHEPLDPVALTGQQELQAMLNRRNIFPNIGVRGSDKKGGWVVHRVYSANAATSPSSALLKVQDDILEVLRRVANPTEADAVAHHSIDAGALPNKYGYELKKRFNFRDFGHKSMREFIEHCPKLAVIMKEGGNKMHVIAKCSCCADGLHRANERGRAQPKRPLEESGAHLAASLLAPAADARPTADAGTGAASSKLSDEETVQRTKDKAARKAAKRAAAAAAAGLTEEEAEAEAAAAKRRRIEKKAIGKEKKAAWLAARS